MKAIHVTRFGGPEVLVPAELAAPQPGPGEIAITVRHAAVGLVDLLLRRGVFADRPGLPQPPFVPGLEVAGTVSALGTGVTGFAIGEPVVSLSSGRGTGGYAEIFVGPAAHAIAIGTLSPALAVAAVPNAAMAHVALSAVAHLAAGERVLVHGALGGFAAAFAGIAKQLGASRVAGTVRAGKLAAAARSRLPFDEIVDADRFGELGTFDIVVDPVGGELRARSLDALGPGGRLLVVGNASDDWTHGISTAELWGRSVTISGFSAGTFFPVHPEMIAPALVAAVGAAGAGLANMIIDELPLSDARIAHERMEARATDGRIVLSP